MAVPLAALAPYAGLIGQAGLTALVSLGIISQADFNNIASLTGKSNPTWEDLQANADAFNAAATAAKPEAAAEWGDKIGSITSQQERMLDLTPSQLETFINSKYKPQSDRQFAAELLSNQTGQSTSFLEDAQGFQIADISAAPATQAALDKGWKESIAVNNDDERAALQPYIDAGVYSEADDGTFTLNTDAAIEATRAYDATAFRDEEAGRSQQPLIGDGAPVATQQQGLDRGTPVVAPLAPSAPPVAAPDTLRQTQPLPVQGARPVPEIGSLPAAPTQAVRPEAPVGTLPAAPPSIPDTDPRAGVQPGALPAAPTQGVRPSPAIGALPAAPTQAVRPEFGPGVLPKQPYQPQVEGKPNAPIGALPPNTIIPTPAELPNILAQPGDTGAVPFQNIEGASANFSGILQALANVSSASDLSAIQDQIASAGGWDNPAVVQAFEAARARLADAPADPTAAAGDAGSYLVSQAKGRNKARTGPVAPPVVVTDEDRALSAATTPIQETVAREEDKAISAATAPVQTGPEGDLPPPTQLGTPAADFSNEEKDEIMADEDAVADKLEVDEVITPEEEDAAEPEIKEVINKATDGETAKAGVLQFAEKKAGGKEKPGFKQWFFYGLALYAGLSHADAKDYVKQRGTAEGWYVGSSENKFNGKITQVKTILTDGSTKNISGQIAFNDNGEVTGFRTVGGRYLKNGAWAIDTAATSGAGSKIAGSSAFVDSETRDRYTLRQDGTYVNSATNKRVTDPNIIRRLEKESSREDVADAAYREYATAAAKKIPDYEKLVTEQANSAARVLGSADAGISIIEQNPEVFNVFSKGAVDPNDPALIKLHNQGVELVNGLALAGLDLLNGNVGIGEYNARIDLYEPLLKAGLSREQFDKYTEFRQHLTTLQLEARKQLSGQGQVTEKEAEHAFQTIGGIRDSATALRAQLQVVQMINQLAADKEEAWVEYADTRESEGKSPTVRGFNLQWNKEVRRRFDEFNKRYR